MMNSQEVMEAVESRYAVQPRQAKRSMVYLVSWPYEDEYGSLELHKIFSKQEDAIKFAKRHKLAQVEPKPILYEYVEG